MTVIVVVSGGVAEVLGDESTFVWDWDNWGAKSSTERVDALCDLIAALCPDLQDAIANAILDVVADNV